MRAIASPASTIRAVNDVQKRWRDTIFACLIYPVGDFTAQLITGEISGRRLFVIFLAGALVYLYEVPNWFDKIDGFEFDRYTRVTRFFARSSEDRHLNWLGRTFGAILYFNPLWVGRHMLFIRIGADAQVFSHFGTAVRESLLLGAKSFALNLPVSLIGNYLIQMRLPAHWRVRASSIFSALLATAYALAFKYL